MNKKAGHPDPTPQRESFTQLLGQLAQNSAAVVRDEIELVIRRIREKVTAGRRGVVLVATGAVVSLAAFMALYAALIIGITAHMAPAMAALVTGVALALLVGVIEESGPGNIEDKNREKEDQECLKERKGGGTGEAEGKRSTEDIRRDIAKEEETISQIVGQIGERTKRSWIGADM